VAEQLLRAGKMADDPAVKRAAIFAAAEIHEKAGHHVEAAEILTHIFRVKDKPKRPKPMGPGGCPMMQRGKCPMSQDRGKGGCPMMQRGKAAGPGKCMCPACRKKCKAEHAKRNKPDGCEKPQCRCGEGGRKKCPTHGEKPRGDHTKCDKPEARAQSRDGDKAGMMQRHKQMLHEVRSLKKEIKKLRKELDEVKEQSSAGESRQTGSDEAYVLAHPEELESGGAGIPEPRDAMQPPSEEDDLDDDDEDDDDEWEDDEDGEGDDDDEWEDEEDDDWDDDVEDGDGDDEWEDDDDDEIEIEDDEIEVEDESTRTNL
jgi:hypothetical protein